jgi:hypothetical protein
LKNRKASQLRFTDLLHGVRCVTDPKIAPAVNTGRRAACDPVEHRDEWYLRKRFVELELLDVRRTGRNRRPSSSSVGPNQHRTNRNAVVGIDNVGITLSYVGVIAVCVYKHQADDTSVPFGAI